MSTDEAHEQAPAGRYDGWMTGGVALAVFSLYLWTAAPSISWFDTGELAIGAFTLGNGHPPGQPLYALSGKAATFLPAASLPFRLTLLSALCATLTVALLPGLLERLCQRMSRPPPHPLVARLFLPGFGLALPVWLQAVRIELYALHLLIAVAMLRITLEDRRRPGAPSRFLLLCLLAGLGLANHHLLVFLALPGLALLAGWPGSTTLARGVAAGGLGLAVYLQAPLRSRAGATLDWGRPDHWSRWWEVVTGRVYQRTFNQLTLEQLFQNLDLHFALFVSLLGAPLLLLALLGAILLLRRAPRTALGLALLVTGNIASTATQALYSAENPDSLGYLSLSFLLLGLLAAVALEAFAATGRAYLTRAEPGGVFSSPAVRRALGGTAALLLGALPALQAWPRPDLRGNWLNHRFSQLLMRSLPAGSLYLSSSDATTFAAWYQRTIEGARPDVATAGVYTLGAPNPMRDAYRPALPPEALDLPPGRLLARLLDLELPHRPVVMSANDLPARREDWLRPTPMSFRVMSARDLPSPQEAGLDAVEGFWQAETARLLEDPAYFRDRQARLLFPAHLEATADHFRALDLLEPARRMLILARKLDPDPGRLMRLKASTLETQRAGLEAAATVTMTEPALRSGSSGDTGAQPASPVATFDRAIALGRYDTAGASASGLSGAPRLYAEARLAWLDGDFARVTAVLEQLRREAPTGPEAAEALRRMGRLLPDREAEAWLREVIPVLRSPEPVAALGLRRLEAGDLDEARRLLEAAVKLAPDAITTRTARGWYYLEERRLWDAHADVQAAARRDPVDPEVLRLTSVLYRQGVR